MTAEKLTDAAIRKLVPPAKGYVVHWEGAFGTRIAAGGTIAFVFNYRVRGTGRERRITIGRFPTWTIGAARQEARKLQQLVDRGGDPLGVFEAERDAPTVGDLIKRFIDEHLPRKSKGTRYNYISMLNQYAAPALAQMKVAEVSFEDIDDLHRKITKDAPYAANRCIAMLSRMFTLAVKWRLRTDNPCKGIEQNAEEKRRRYLRGDEMEHLLAALASYPDQRAANIFRMLLLTGARRGEVLSMRWDNLDLSAGTWSKPAASVKQRTAHSVPLSAPARQLLSEIEDHASMTLKSESPAGRTLKSEFVFPSTDNPTGHVIEVRRPWRAICKRAGIAGLRIHDLRHGFASQLAAGRAFR
jgi:integrase